MVGNGLCKNSTDLKNKNNMEQKKFKTAIEMVTWLMTYEGRELADDYGRKWKYEKFKFYFKDIGTTDKYKEKLSCLHLYGTHLVMLES